jgi:subtilisin family serine protease
MRALAKAAPHYRVLDSIHDDGAKLVELSPASLISLRVAQPSVRIVPVVYHRPALIRRRVTPSAQTAAKRVPSKISVMVKSALTGKPVKGATVAAFTDFANHIGAEATTNANGVAALALGGSRKTVERLYVYPRGGLWPGLLQNVRLKSGVTIALTQLDLTFTDALRFFYQQADLDTGAGVTVGVVDTGIAAHPDLRIDGGMNTVTGENAADFGDNGGEGHGTHVAGIIAARGTPPQGLRGVAPGVTLRSYRVFGRGSDRASNFAIAKAIDAAVSDGCDLINMSLGGGPPDPATEQAIADARAAGCVVIVANGNDSRQPVDFPASDSLALAVSAMGRKGTFPMGTTEEGDVARPFGTDENDFIAEFSNVGDGTDLTGPGVGIMSTLPSGYGVMDGTSMACPAATGAAARVLGSLPSLRAMARSEARSDALVQAILGSAKSRGFGPAFEGHGLILVP